MEGSELTLSNILRRKSIADCLLGWLLVFPLQVKILRGKYSLGSYLIPESINRTEASFLWSSLSRLWQTFRQNIKWAIRDGRTTRFWIDTWIGERLLLKAAQSLGCFIDDNSHVRDLVQPNGAWDVERVVDCLWRRC
ncbi:Uncharacterized protein TCM_040961 [Theobroma cacao]|uniref:Reverse transcriptase zinc-binding domain-containing protein n=1 Tax=Theobroma cacao TaxID=3641 RepID=A0A061GTW2_THECC|nr:Uncharacterized protein TCM_040961 [Theobroma cacao]